jgi:ATP-dependent Clp protease ATP-binding subunit ClpA
MATLHVRKVPDYLYEAIRERAEREGRSIGGEVICLLEETLLAQGLRRRRGLLEPFAEDGRQAVALAQDEARELGHRYLGTEHLLLGVLRLDESRGARALASLGIDRDRVVRAVVEDVGRGNEAVEGTIPFTPRSKKALELALRESLAARSGAVDTGHVLLGIARVEEGVAARMLTRLDADLDTLRSRLIQHQAHGSQVVVQAPELLGEDRYRVLELAGSADDWAAALNDASAQGWRLVSIERAGDERRAVLVRP